MSEVIRSYFDTSVLVAALVRSHPSHAEAEARLRMARAGDEIGMVSAHGIAECFSVLTRTPFQPPIHPSDAWRLIDRELLSALKVVWLDGLEQVEVVRRCSAESIAGGRIHDAMHLRTANKERCVRIYTLNLKDFKALAEPGQVLAVMAP